ncbi:unnamed protein product [Caenorhabditis auriculariae]|uniref:Uncharacterized protein n=1 Tax=Caenorhabditis auriculariae TaxID=2777116 RepID=A0A8S1GPR5_9PELO|nr:unnamed protein product [Caenorhabditis auriculariae]
MNFENWLSGSGKEARSRRKSSLSQTRSPRSVAAASLVADSPRRRFSLATTSVDVGTSSAPLHRLLSLSEHDYLFEKKTNESNPIRRADSTKNRRGRRMGRAMRVVVVGCKRVGKTAILRQVACVEDITNRPYDPTIEDTYQVLLEEADKQREILILHDTAGIPHYGNAELKKAYVQAADAFVLVYSVADYESFNRVDLLKKWIDKQFGKEKKEVPIVVLANMKDVPATVESGFAQNWATREKVKLFEVSAKDRNSLVDFIHYLGHRHFHPIKESKFSLSKKLKSEKSNPAIVMDFFDSFFYILSLIH